MKIYNFLQASSLETETSTVLLAAHGHGSAQNIMPQLTTQAQNSGIPMHVPVISSSQQGSSQPQFTSSQQQYSFVPQQQQFSQSYRNGSRGRGGYRGRYPRDPCAICGRNNHATEFCYYKGQTSQVQPWSNSFQGYPTQIVQGAYPQLQSFPTQGFHTQGNVGFPQGNFMVCQGQYPGIPTYNFASQGVAGTPSYSGIPGPPVNHHHQHQILQPSPPPSAQAHFTGYTGTCNMPSQYSIPQGPPSTSSPFGNMFAGPQLSATTNPTTAPQWYMDSGATQHITNNLQNLQLAQSIAQSEGIVVGNGLNFL